MKKLVMKCLIVSLFIQIGTTLLAQTDWTKYGGNPVLEVGPAGSWDDQMVGQSSVLIDGTTYRMWYSGDDGTHNRIGHATSPDGITWAKDTLNPVLDVGPAGSWDDERVMFPTVVFNGSMFHIWYYGSDGTHGRIGHATSPDGITWTKDTLNPVLDVGPAGSWDDDGLLTPFVRFDGAIYHMWYSGDDGTHNRIGYATSPDGITWTKDTLNPVLDVGPAGSWDSPRVQSQCVINNGTNYQMWYSGGGLFTWRIGHATSPDGITWTKDTLNPVLDVGSAGSWDHYYVASPSVIFDIATSTYKMWYMGGFEAWQGNIGYAIDTPPVGIDDNNPTDLPGRFALSQNYPNPFNPVTTIQYELPQRSDVQITVYDLLGKEVIKLVYETQEAGFKSVQWDATNIPSGMYFYQIRAGEFIDIKKCVLIK